MEEENIAGGAPVEVANEALNSAFGLYLTFTDEIVEAAKKYVAEAKAGNRVEVYVKLNDKVIMTTFAEFFQKLGLA